MKIKIFFPSIIIFFSIVFFIFYKGLENKNIYTPNLNVQKDIPNIKVKLFDSDNLISSDEIFKNDKYYLLNIWASWCIPCKDEHPFLLNLNDQKNIELIGMNYKDKNENAKKFLNELGNPYALVISDPDGTVAIEWGAYGVPETFLIYNKKIIKKVIGPINEKSLNEIEELIK